MKKNFNEEAPCKGASSRLPEKSKVVLGETLWGCERVQEYVQQQALIFNVGHSSVSIIQDFII